MPSTNPFFTSTTGYTGENDLIDNLVIEQIGMFGIDLLYMPRENINLDQLLHESTKSEFNQALSIPMYIKSFDGYDNSMEMLTKFGVRSADELTLVMSRSQWTAFYAPYIKSMYNAQSGRPQGALNDPLEGQTSRRPKEGDVIYFPYDGGMFEVKYVQFDQPFYQIAKGYVFEMQCERFEYSGENFNTGITEIDSITDRATLPNVQLQMIEGGKSTFQFNEKVTIYNLTDTDIATLSTQSGDPVLTDDLKFIDPDGIDYFQFFNDSGFMRQVLTVEGNVSAWNAVDRLLSIENLTDMNPERGNPLTGNLDINTFDKVLVIGQTTGAAWTSISARQHPKPFDDAADIQQEFNEIKIFDPADASPFGFY